MTMTSSPPADEQSPVELAEDDLRGRLAAGDEAAFELLVGRFYVRVERLAFRLLGWGGGDADDVAQDVFAALWRRRAEPRAGETWTWLAAVTVNQCRQRRRWWGRHRRRVEGLRRAAPLRASAPADGPLMAREAFVQVRDAIAALPAPDREVIVLRYLEELPPEEIAGVLGVSPAALKVRLHRARARLRPRLEGLLTE
jgi:RNA polymerase sigma-70 factor (ECF subfamily)